MSSSDSLPSLNHQTNQMPFTASDIVIRFVFLLSRKSSAICFHKSSICAHDPFEGFSGGVCRFSSGAIRLSAERTIVRTTHNQRATTGRKPTIVKTGWKSLFIVPVWIATSSTKSFTLCLWMLSTEQSNRQYTDREPWIWVLSPCQQPKTSLLMGMNHLSLKPTVWITRYFRGNFWYRLINLPIYICYNSYFSMHIVGKINFLSEESRTAKIQPHLSLLKEIGKFLYVGFRACHLKSSRFSRQLLDRIGRKNHQISLSDGLKNTHMEFDLI